MRPSRWFLMVARYAQCGAAFGGEERHHARVPARRHDRAIIGARNARSDNGANRQVAKIARTFSWDLGARRFRAGRGSKAEIEL
jgi:hypothetical protein